MCQAAEKLQENGAVQQSTTVSASTTTLANTATITTVSNSIADLPHSTCSKKTLSKTTCSRGGTESTSQKSKAVTTTILSQTECLARSVCAKPAPKLLPEGRGREKPTTDKTAQLPASSSSSLTTDTSPQISTKLAKGRRGQKIGQHQDVGNSSQQSVGQKSSRQPVATSSGPSLSPAVKNRSTHAAGSSSMTGATISQTETSSKVISKLPNGLVAGTDKICSKADHLSHVSGAMQHGNVAKPMTQLPNGFQAHADKHFAKPNHVARNGSNPDRGSKLGTEMADGPSSDKTSRKIDSVASSHLEQNNHRLEQSNHVKALESSEVCGQSSSLMDMLGDGSQVMTTHTDQNTATATAKGKKARRKGRGKEDKTSVG